MTVVVLSHIVAQTNATARAEAIIAAQTEQETAQNVLQAMMQQLEEQNKRIAALQQRLAASEANRKQDEAVHQATMKAAETTLEKVKREQADKLNAAKVEINAMPAKINTLNTKIKRIKMAIGLEPFPPKGQQDRNLIFARYAFERNLKSLPDLLAQL